MNRCQINFIPVKHRYKNQVEKSIPYPGADADANHIMIIMGANLQLIKVLKKNRVIKKNELTKAYQLETEKRIKYLCSNNKIEQISNTIKFTLINSAQRINDDICFKKKIAGSA